MLRNILEMFLMLIGQAISYLMNPMFLLQVVQFLGYVANAIIWMLSYLP